MTQHRISNSKPLARALLGAFLLVASGAVAAQAAASNPASPTAKPAVGSATANACTGELGGNTLTLKPTPGGDNNGGFINRLALCAMWQNFYYLNWPSTPGQAGVPNASAPLGQKGQTVWETFMPANQVFLPNAQKPLPWGKQLSAAALPKAAASLAAAGPVRVLQHQSKITAVLPRGLKMGDVQQVDGLTLFDQNSKPVYYEVLINKVLYDYIVTNGLYNAQTQLSYGQKNVIVPPQGSFEIKAAWKELTDAEAASGRFHNARAWLTPPKGKAYSATVGLVGLHVFAGGGSKTGNTAGLWGSFYQANNVPPDSVANPTGSFNFYNAQANNLPRNVPTPSNAQSSAQQTATPTQVTQVFPNDPAAGTVNAYALGLIGGQAGGPSNNVWLNYALINTQWPFAPFTPAAAPQALPSNLGLVSKANTDTLVNPVLETFLQQKGTSCMGCHAFGTTALSIPKSSPTLSIATGYSFLFGRAQSPLAKGKPSSHR